MGNSLILTVTEELFQTDDISWRAFPSTDTNVVIDYGDGTTENYGLDRDYFSHDYTDNLSEHTVTISNITGIEQGIFNNNTSITSVVIPSSVTSMGQGVFDYCANLESITFESSTPPTIENRLLDGANDNLVIRVPTGSLSAYQNASNYPKSGVTYVEYAPQSSSQEETPTGNLYNHLKTLIKQWVYDKTEINEGFVAKSNTTGLLKNDGTVDNRNFALNVHTHPLSDITDLAGLNLVELTIEYNDGTTETLNVLGQIDIGDESL